MKENDDDDMSAAAPPLLYSDGTQKDNACSLISSQR